MSAGASLALAVLGCEGGAKSSGGRTPKAPSEPAIAAPPVDNPIAQSPPPMNTAAQVTLETPEQAIARFRGEWPRFASAPGAADANALVTSPQIPPQAVLRADVQQQRELLDRLGDSEELYVHGTITDLDGVGPVWVVTYDGMLGPGLGAALTRSGQVLLVWIVPEG